MQPDHVGDGIRVLTSIAAGRIPTTAVLHPPEDHDGAHEKSGRYSPPEEDSWRR
jgi:hypothetical protein